MRRNPGLPLFLAITSCGGGVSAGPGDGGVVASDSGASSLSDADAASPPPCVARTLATRAGRGTIGGLAAGPLRSRRLRRLHLLQERGRRRFVERPRSSAHRGLRGLRRGRNRRLCRRLRSHHLAAATDRTGGRHRHHARHRDRRPARAGRGQPLLRAVRAGRRSHPQGRRRRDHGRPGHLRPGLRRGRPSLLVSVHRYQRELLVERARPRRRLAARHRHAPPELRAAHVRSLGAPGRARSCSSRTRTRCFHPGARIASRPPGSARYPARCRPARTGAPTRSSWTDRTPTTSTGSETSAATRWTPARTSRGVRQPIRPHEEPSAPRQQRRIASRSRRRRQAA